MSTLATAWLVLTVGWQAAEPAGAKPTAEAIQAAIEQLGDEKITVRDQASQKLWEAGPAAEAALRKALASTDAEVRFRARAILERFRFGIFADTPPEIVLIIQQFRNGDAAGRANALQQLAEKRQFATLFALIETETDPNQRFNLTSRFVQDPNGLVNQLLSDGQFAEAERILEMSTSNDQGLIGLAAYLLVRGTLDERIASLRGAAAADPKAARRLTYLLRAKGDFAAARAAATAAQDPLLERALAYEAADWKALAARAEWHSPRLPAPWNNNNSSADFERIERLGYGAAFHRLAGNADEADKLLKEIRQLFTDSPPIRTFCVEAIFLNDRPDEGIQLQKTVNPAVAFDLLAYQHRYREAFDYVGWAPDKPIDQKWFDSLPAEGNQAVAQFYQRFRLACQIARTLNMLGKKKESSALFARLAAIAAEPGNTIPPAQLWMQLSIYEYRSNQWDLAFEHAGKGMAESGNSTALFRSLFGLRGEEAEAWSLLIQRGDGAQPLKNVLAQVHRLLQFPPPADEPAEEFPKRVDAALKAAGDQPLPTKFNSILQVGVTCLAREQLDLARKCWSSIATEFPAAAIRLGDLDAQQQRWDDAARWYDSAWKKDRQQILALYLAGLAQEKAGQAEPGRALREKASLLAIGSRSRHTLASGLQQRDYAADASAQWTILLRTGPFEQWELNDAARQLGDLLADQDPGRAAQLSQQYMLCNLRTAFSFLETESLFRMPFMIHKQRAQALIGAGDFTSAHQEIQLARTSCPHDVRLAEDVVPLLDKAGRRDEADRLFAQQYELLDAIVRDFPDSAFHRNNLAWLAARCHRKLDEALVHAQKAVELTPDYAGYLDTLAEVHFHRGQRDEAVKLEQRVVQMAPRNKVFRDQLARYEKAPLPQ